MNTFFFCRVCGNKTEQEYYRGLCSFKCHYKDAISYESDKCLSVVKPIKFPHADEPYSAGSGGLKRAAWQHFKGKISQSYIVIGLCGNKACINPEHMEVEDRAVYLRERHAELTAKKKAKKSKRLIENMNDLEKRLHKLKCGYTNAEGNTIYLYIPENNKE